MVVKWLIILFFATLPFQWTIFSTPSFDLSLVRVLSGIIFLIWAAEVLRKKQMTLPPVTTTFFFSAFFFWAILSSLWADSETAAIRKFLFFLNFLPFFFVLGDSFREDKWKKRLFKGLVLGAVSASLVGILQFLSQFIFSLPTALKGYFVLAKLFLGENFASVVESYPSLLVNINGETILRATAFFPDPHVFSYYVLLVLPVSAFIALEERNFFWKLAPSILFLGVMLSFSRSAYMALIGVTVVGGAFYWVRKKKIGVKTLLLLMLVGIVMVSSPVLPRISSSFSKTDGSAQERIRLYQEALEVIQEYPLTGVGLGNYKTYIKPTAALREPIYVHNLYLDIAVELGMIGLILFLALLGGGYTIKVQEQEKNQEVRFLQYSLALYMTQSLFETSLFSLHIFPLLLFVLAFLYAAKKQ